MDCDYGAREKECRECPAAEKHRDEDGYCGVCKMPGLNEKYPAEFRAWVENLKRLYLWRKAGYPIERDELSFDEWDALGQITRFYELKDLSALMQTGGTSSPKS